MEIFHARGYAAASLEDLATAMGLNRPSIYNAFGNKESLYRQALAHFIDQIRSASRRALFTCPELSRALERFYSNALEVYFGGDPPLGCFVFCTAPAEAVTHADIGDDMRKALGEIDRVLELRFRQAQRDGEFPAGADCGGAAKLAQAVLHSLALRARAGESRRSLNRLVRTAVARLV